MSKQPPEITGEFTAQMLRDKNIDQLMRFGFTRQEAELIMNKDKEKSRKMKEELSDGEDQEDKKESNSKDKIMELLLEIVKKL